MRGFTGLVIHSQWDNSSCVRVAEHIVKRSDFYIHNRKAMKEGQIHNKYPTGKKKPLCIKDKKNIYF